MPFCNTGCHASPCHRDIEHFRKLSALGGELIGWHLLRGAAIKNHSYRGRGSCLPIGLKEREKELSHRSAMWTEVFGSIRPSIFTDVPADVWNYEVGAHQVCEKWLKDRKGLALTYAEIQQYRNILVAVAENTSAHGRN